MSDMRSLLDSINEISEAGPIKKPGQVMGYEMGGSSGAAVGGGVPNIGAIGAGIAKAKPIPKPPAPVKPTTTSSTTVSKPLPPGVTPSTAGAGRSGQGGPTAAELAAYKAQSAKSKTTTAPVKTANTQTPAYNAAKDSQAANAVPSKAPVTQPNPTAQNPVTQWLAGQSNTTTAPSTAGPINTAAQNLQGTLATVKQIPSNLARLAKDPVQYVKDLPTPSPDQLIGAMGAGAAGTMARLPSMAKVVKPGTPSVTKPPAPVKPGTSTTVPQPLPAGVTPSTAGSGRSGQGGPTAAELAAYKAPAPVKPAPEIKPPAPAPTSPTTAPVTRPTSPTTAPVTTAPVTQVKPTTAPVTTAPVTQVKPTTAPVTQVKPPPTLTNVVKPTGQTTAAPGKTPVTRPAEPSKDPNSVGKYRPGGERDTLGRKEPGTGTNNPFLPPPPKPQNLKKPAAATAAAAAAALYLANQDKKPPVTGSASTGGQPSNANGQPQVDGAPSPSKIELPTVGPQGPDSPFYVVPPDTTPKPPAPAPAPIAPSPAPAIKPPAPAPIAPSPAPAIKPPAPAPAPVTPAPAPAPAPVTPAPTAAAPSSTAASGNETGTGSGSDTGYSSRDGDSIETRLRKNKYIKETAVQKLLNNFTKFIESSTKNKSKAK